jgi:hypothetical protein
MGHLLIGLALAWGVWQPLFDGRTAEGWLEVTGGPFPASSWGVEDGCLHGRVVEGGYQDLRTVGVFREFELEFEWRIAPGGNSGVKYFVEKVDTWNARQGGGRHARGRGAEYQLWDDREAPPPEKRAGALYGKLGAAGAGARPAGQWNESRIVAAGSRVEHWLNGVKVLEYRRAPVEGPIVLQNHRSDVWFRNLRVRRFE